MQTQWHGRQFVFPKGEQEKSMCAQQTETGQMAPPSSRRPPTHGYCHYRHPIPQSCHHQRMNGAGPHCLRKNANLSSMERSKPSSPVSLAGGDAALSKYFHHLLLLPTRSPGLAHLSEALCLPHSKVQEHEVPRCPGCLHHMEHGFLRVAPHLSPDSCSLRS